MTQPETMPGLDSPATNGKGRTPPDKRRKLLTIILGIFAVLAVAGLIWWLYASQFEETDDATLDGHIHPIGARVGGTIQQVLVNDNELVKQGQLLVVIDPTDYQVALRQAELSVKAAEVQAATIARNIPLAEKQASSEVLQAQGTMLASQSEIQQSHANVTAERAGVSAAQQTLIQQEANYQKALIDYQRYAGADPEAISAQRLDEARTGMKIALAARDSARGGVLQAQARLNEAQAGVTNSVSKLTESRGTFQGAQAQKLQVGIAEGNYQNAQASVDASKAALEQARLNLSYTRIIAPADGRVGRKSAEVGQRIQAGEPLLSVVQPDVWVIANFKETQLKRMRPGQPVRVDIDAFPDHEFTGTVDSFSPATGAQFALLPPENATGNFTKIVQRVPVKILLDPKTVRGYENLLAPGMSVVAKVDVTASVSKSNRNVQVNQSEINTHKSDVNVNVNDISKEHRP